MIERTCRSCQFWGGEKRTRANADQVYCEWKGICVPLTPGKDCPDYRREPGSDEEEWPDAERMI